LAHASHPSFSGGENRRIAVQAVLSIKRKTLLKKITKSKKDWQHSSSCREPAYKGQGPELIKSIIYTYI
jgi:hypothetical protein